MGLHRRITTWVIGLLLLGLACRTQEGRPTTQATPECRIGVVMPTTGEMAPYGAEGILAARIALEDARSLGTDTPVAIFEEDSASQPEGANAAAAALLAPPKSVQVIVGEINSANTAAMVNPARVAHVPIVAPTASMISLTHMSKTVFRVWPSDAYEARMMADYLHGQGVRRVGVLFIQVQYGEEMAKLFATEFQARGGEVQLEGYPRDTFDFKPLLRRMSSFSDLYLISYVEDAALLLKQAYELARGGQATHRVFGTSVLDTTKLWEKGGVAVEGLTFAVVGPSATQDLRKRAAFENRYRVVRVAAESSLALRSAAKAPTFAGYHVYDAVAVAIRACAAAAAEQNPIDAETIDRHLRALSYEGLTGRIQFDERGDLASERTVVFKRFVGSQIEVVSTQ